MKNKVALRLAEDPLEEMVALSQAEREQLETCESILRRGLATFFEVGSALLTIREQKLYRASHTTFEKYCGEAWDIGRSYAWRVIGAAERIKLLGDEGDLPKPTNEFQMRPFLKIEPKQFPRAWKQAIRKAKDGKLTPRVIQEVLGDYPTHKSAPAAQKPSAKRSRFAKHISAGQILALLHQAKCAVEKSETERAVSAIQRIEELLFGPEMPLATPI